jgi:3-methyladenine DNA glycosylase AlkD
MKASTVYAELYALKNNEKAKGVARFFKCGKGEYGEGDLFLGITVPRLRRIAKKYQNLPLPEVRKLIENKYHEVRLVGFLMLVSLFEKADRGTQKAIYSFYIMERKWINNWDLVDITTPKIIGVYLLENKAQRKILYRFIKSKNVWERRMAVLATFAFLKEGDFKDALCVGENLLSDKHDLIHKAVGWMLREVGKRDRIVLEMFLTSHISRMPRTTLRYAIERFSQTQRKKYLEL